MDLLDKLRIIERRRAIFAPGASIPGATVIERVLGACEVVVDGRPTLMFGSNNYLGLTLHPEVVEAAREALAQYGTGTTGSRAANGTLAIHEELERDFTQWFGKRHAMIFSTGYQANLSVIGGLCGPADVILIDGDSHASIYDATRQTASQVIAFRTTRREPSHKARTTAARARNRLVVVEGLYLFVAMSPRSKKSSGAGPTAPISSSTRRSARHLPGRARLGCAEAQGVLEQVDFVVGTFSKSLAGIGGVRVGSRRLRALHFLAVRLRRRDRRQYRKRPRAVRVIRRQPELRQQLWTNIRRLRSGLQQLGYAIGSTESPIVPILTGDEDRTIALWQQLLAAGLYLNLIVPPSCPKDECVLRASCSAAFTPEHLTRALDIFARVGAEFGVARATRS
jgi:7-keto-8-aminopelargonate synthetase-like enzyme